MRPSADALGYTRGLPGSNVSVNFFASLAAAACDAQHIPAKTASVCYQRPDPGKLVVVASPRARALAVLLALAMNAGCSFRPRDREAITGLLADQVAAWNRGDLDGFLRAYEPSEALVFTSGGTINRGFVATRARYLQRYAARGIGTMGHLALEVLEIRALGRDGAVVLGRWSLSATAAAGEGVFTLALLRTSAGWRIVHDHTSLAPRGRDQKQSDAAGAPEL
jgi:beta-aspartyl-peptidase (threonine type)